MKSQDSQNGVVHADNDFTDVSRRKQVKGDPGPTAHSKTHKPPQSPTGKQSPNKPIPGKKSGPSNSDATGSY